MPNADDRGGAPPQRGMDNSDIVLAELVSRVLDRGVVVAGDVTISVAGIDLVYLGLSLRIASTETLLRRKRSDLLPAPRRGQSAESDASREASSKTSSEASGEASGEKDR